jgi:hypothetical protein
MRKLTLIPLALAALVLALSLVPGTRADDWNKKTVVNFNQDVEIPGQILPAGTYVFKLFPSRGDRSLVQVWTADEQYLIATLITIGDTYPNPSGDPYFVLDNTGVDEGYPPSIVSWFFAGSDEGRDFIYSGSSNTRIVDSQPTTQPDQTTQPQQTSPPMYPTDQNQPQQTSPPMYPTDQNQPQQ